MCKVHKVGLRYIKEAIGREEDKNGEGEEG
jgi:hypothetical protein